MAVDDSYTKALLHFNGANNSTTFTDESGKTWTPAGNAKISTAQYKFAPSAGVFDGAGDYITTPDSADFDFGSGDFTIDFWIRPAALAATYIIFTKRTNNTIVPPFHIYIDATKLYGLATHAVDWDTNVNGLHGWLVDTWHHVAWVRYGNVHTLYNDGNSLGTPVTKTGALKVNNNVVVCGGDTNADYVNGYIDEVRVSKGIARWTTDFIPPTAAYSRVTLSPTAAQIIA